MLKNVDVKMCRCREMEMIRNVEVERCRFIERYLDLEICRC